MNKIETSKAIEISKAQEVFDIKELQKLILGYGKKDPEHRFDWRFISKSFYQVFLTLIHEPYLQKRLVEYCNNELTTHPRSTYHLYRRLGTNNSTYLSYYAVEAAKDVPWTPTLSVVTAVNIANMAFLGINKAPLLYPSIMIAVYFISIHVLTLCALTLFNYYMKVKLLFNIMSILIIIQNLIINITSSI